MKPLTLLILLGISCASAQQAEPQVPTVEFFGRDVPYDIVNGQVLIFGDIISGRAAEGKHATLKSAVAVALPGNDWPKVNGVAQIPYENATAYPPAVDAINQFNQLFTGIVQLVPRNGQPDYVTFRQDTVCAASLGRVGGQQFITFADYCGVLGMLHEFAHTLGLLHENQHPDRDQFLQINWDNVTKDPKGRAVVALNPRATRLGLYDIDSILDSTINLPSRNGLPTMTTIPPGMSPDFNKTSYSEGNIDAIKRLAGAAPTRVTVTSVPAGLNVVVDGATISTPQTFDWAINSTHDISVPDAPQKIRGAYYTYGRWNGDPAKTHQITVAPGSGGRTDPATSPAVTLYAAYFVPFNAITLAPSAGTGTGTVRFDATPTTFPTDTGTYFPQSQGQVNLVATPDAGSNFYRFTPRLISAGGAVDPRSNQSNPYPTNFGGNFEFTANFTKQPVTIINTEPAGQLILIDGVERFTPAIYSPEFDPTWTPGSTHTIDVAAAPQIRNNYNLRRYAFREWSDGGTRRHTIQAAQGGNVTITARFDTQYQAILTATGENSCSSTFTLNPASPDNFYNIGTPVQVTANPAAGFQLVDWGGLAPAGNLGLTQTLIMNDEQVATAQFNTVATPLSITSVTPDSLPLGADSAVITINGTGFTPATQAVLWRDIDGLPVTPTFVNANQLTAVVPTESLETAGTLRVQVRNVSGTCRVPAEIEVPVARQNR